MKVKLTSKLGWSGGQYNVSDLTWSHTSRERCSMKRAIFFVTSAEFIAVSSSLLTQKRTWRASVGGRKTGMWLMRVDVSSKMVRFSCAMGIDLCDGGITDVRM